MLCLSSESLTGNPSGSFAHTVLNEVDGIFDLGQELQSIILDASSLANTRSARIFYARYSQQPETDSQHFAEIAIATRTFILETELMAGQMLTPLRAALTSQASSKCTANVARFPV